MINKTQRVGKWNKPSSKMQMIINFLPFFEVLGNCFFFLGGGGSVEYVNNLEGYTVSERPWKKGGRGMAARISSDPLNLRKCEVSYASLGRFL